MSARIAPEPIGAVNTAIAEHRPRFVPAAPPLTPAAQSSTTNTGAAAADDTAAAAPAPLAEAPPPPEPTVPGTAYVMAVISGALSPRATTMQEVFLRTGTDWVPPESEYRLADKKI
jgi:hypothetical protein